MSGLRSLLHSTYKSAAERVLPARSQSAFKEKGVSIIGFESGIWVALLSHERLPTGVRRRGALKPRCCYPVHLMCPPHQTGSPFSFR